MSNLIQSARNFLTDADYVHEMFNWISNSITDAVNSAQSNIAEMRQNFGISTTTAVSAIGTVALGAAAFYFQLQQRTSQSDQTSALASRGIIHDSNVSVISLIAQRVLPRSEETSQLQAQPEGQEQSGVPSSDEPDDYFEFFRNLELKEDDGFTPSVLVPAAAPSSRAVNNPEAVRANNTLLQGRDTARPHLNEGGPIVNHIPFATSQDRSKL